MRRIGFLSLFFLAAASSGALASRGPYSESELKGLWRKGSSDPRKQITSNPTHFWAWAATYGERYLGTLLHPTGIVMGDPHLRNVFDYRKGGAARLAVADVDDGGEAPLILDLIRYETYLEASTIKTKISEVIAEYVKGLAGSHAPAPRLLREAAKVDTKGILSSHRDYISRHLSLDGTLNTSSLNLTPPEKLNERQKKQLEALIQSALKQTGLKKSWGAGHTVHDNGGSEGMDRFWILLGSESRATFLVEFKELQRPATDYFQEQAEQPARVKGIEAVYSEHGFEKALFGVETAESEYFWLRPRHFQVLDFDLEKVSREDAREFAMYFAHWLGQIHGMQKNGKALKEILSREPSAAKAAVEKMVRAYLEEADKLSH